MSASDVVKQVRATPRRERERVVRAILAMEDEGPASEGASEKRVKWPDIQARATRIFGKRAVPNLVLLEREEETV
jgi:hypothetical protein